MTSPKPCTYPWEGRGKMNEKLTEKVVDGEPQPIRIFTDDAIQRQIDAGIARLAATDNAAVVVFEVRRNGELVETNAALVTRLNQHFSVAVAGHTDWKDKWAVGGEIAWKP